jgi:hypothetical protein
MRLSGKERPFSTAFTPQAEVLAAESPPGLDFRRSGVHHYRYGGDKPGQIGEGIA